MNAPTSNPVTFLTNEPHRRGISWLVFHSVALWRYLGVFFFSRFISLLGSVSTPGMKPVGFLQAWALRRMGADCQSNEIWIGPHVDFDYPNHLVFGKRIVIGANSRITARGTIRVGDDFLSAPGLYINTGSHDLATLVPTDGPITIGPSVWCGLRVTLCAGVTIGEGAVIGAGSVVNKDIPPRHVAVGVPCKPSRNIEHLRTPGKSLWTNFPKR
ncbi:MAG: acyltransferase [Verrucomicrobia bacterium]|nr:acyltransferase [Verrucomicrobiota bacterium]